MKQQLFDIIYDWDTKHITSDEMYDKVCVLFNVSDLFERGYSKGWAEATSEACKEIAKNYKPNEH